MVRHIDFYELESHVSLQALRQKLRILRTWRTLLQLLLLVLQRNTAHSWMGNWCPLASQAVPVYRLLPRQGKDKGSFSYCRNWCLRLLLVFKGMRKRRSFFFSPWITYFTHMVLKKIRRFETDAESNIVLDQGFAYYIYIFFIRKIFFNIFFFMNQYTFLFVKIFVMICYESSFRTPFFSFIFVL